MPDYSDLALIPLPLGGEGNVVPSDLARMVDAFESNLNLYATDENDRNERHATAKVGTLVSSTISDTIWRKGVGGVWKTVWKQTALTTFPPTWVVGKTAASGDSTYQYNGDHIDVQINGQYTGDPLTGSATGNIADVEFCALPDFLRMPFDTPFRYRANFLYGDGDLRSGGSMVLRTYCPTAVLDTGTAVLVTLALPIKQLVA